MWCSVVKGLVTGAMKALTIDCETEVEFQLMEVSYKYIYLAKWFTIYIVDKRIITKSLTKLMIKSILNYKLYKSLNDLECIGM